MIEWMGKYVTSTFVELAEYEPQLNVLRHEKPNPTNVLQILTLLDNISTPNGYQLLQIVAIPESPAIIVFVKSQIKQYCTCGTNI